MVADCVGYSFPHTILAVTVMGKGAADGVRVVQTAAGALRGTTEGGVGVWRGVPYAEQPVGPRRFRAPAPQRPWTGVRDAVEHGPLPPQGKTFVGGGRDDPKARDEACLTLTVWSPDTAARLPVMVWIPGGAFIYGAGQFQFYNGSRLAANGNVVVVNVTYRIGVFGGFELGSLGDGFDDNLCLRDQIAALQWVAENISAFGGDPDRVTVFGESAGATSVLALLASPAAAGLFHRAIAQSPALPLIADYQTRAEQAEQFLQEIDVAPADLKGLPQRRLRRAAGLIQLRSAAATPTLAHGLTHGVDLLPHHPVEAARRGSLPGIPLIVGTNTDEASMFAWSKPPMLPTTRANIDHYFARRDEAAKDRVLAAYPGYPRRRALVDIGADAMFTAPTWAFADAHTAHSDTYVYRYGHMPTTLRALRLGATHGSEIVHVHHSYDSYLGRKLHPLGRRLPPAVGRRMQRTWLQFATADRPEPWSRYELDRRATLVIGTTRDRVVDDPDELRRAAWNGMY